MQNEIKYMNTSDRAQQEMDKALNNRTIIEEGQSKPKETSIKDLDSGREIDSASADAEMATN